MTLLLLFLFDVADTHKEICKPKHLCRVAAITRGFSWPTDQPMPAPPTDGRVECDNKVNPDWYNKKHPYAYPDCARSIIKKRIEKQ